MKILKLTDLVEAIIIFNQGTLDGARKEEHDILRYERGIHELEEHVEGENSNKSLSNELKDYILETNESHSVII